MAAELGDGAGVPVCIGNPGEAVADVGKVLHDEAVHTGLALDHGDDALHGPVAPGLLPGVVDLSGGTDGGSALLDGGDDAVAVNGGHGVVAALPGDFRGFAVPGGPVHAQTAVLTGHHGDLVGIQIELVGLHAHDEHIGDHIGGHKQGGPAAGAVAADCGALGGLEIDLVGHIRKDLVVIATRSI